MVCALFSPKLSILLPNIMSTYANSPATGFAALARRSSIFQRHLARRLNTDTRTQQRVPAKESLDSGILATVSQMSNRSTIYARNETRRALTSASATDGMVASSAYPSSSVFATLGAMTTRSTIHDRNVRRHAAQC